MRSRTLIFRGASFINLISIMFYIGIIKHIDTFVVFNYLVWTMVLESSIEYLTRMFDWTMNATKHLFSFCFKLLSFTYIVYSIGRLKNELASIFSKLFWSRYLWKVNEWNDLSTPSFIIMFMNNTCAARDLL